MTRPCQTQRIKSAVKIIDKLRYTFHADENQRGWFELTIYILGLEPDSRASRLSSPETAFSLTPATARSIQDRRRNVRSLVIIVSLCFVSDIVFIFSQCLSGNPGYYALPGRIMAAKELTTESDFTVFRADSVHTKHKT